MPFYRGAPGKLAHRVNRLLADPQRSRSLVRILLLLAGLVVGTQACSDMRTPEGKPLGSTTQALDQLTPIPCSAWSYAVATSSGSVMLNAATLVDSYDSSAGAYGGQNVGSGAIVQSADSITNNGGVVKGQQRQHTA